MLRNFSNNRYQFFKQEKEIPIQEEHFQPIFFAQDVEQLRNNKDAIKTLQKFRIFVKPEEVEAAIEEGKKKMKFELGVSQNLSKKLQQE